MSSQTRLDSAYKNAKRINFDSNSKLILFSDCHRGDASFADDFANNRNLYFHALGHYYKNNFQYIELGDGDELWENLFFNSIFEANKNDLDKNPVANYLMSFVAVSNNDFKNAKTFIRRSIMFSQSFENIEKYKNRLALLNKYLVIN